MGTNFSVIPDLTTPRGQPRKFRENLAIFTKAFAISEGLMPEDRRVTRFFDLINLERGLIAASAALLIGCALLLAAVNQWRLTGFGNLDYARTMRLVVPGVTLTALGFQTMVSSFFVSILGLRRK
jgi:hypothetical protein